MTGHLLGIDFGGSKIAVAAGSTDGRIKRRRYVGTHAERGARQAVERGVAAALDLLGRRTADLEGVGVATMGITRQRDVLLAPNVPGWEELALPDMLRDALGDVPIRIENDVKAATFAELRHGALVGVQNGMYVNLGTGIAAGLVIGGRIVRGAHEAAGEIGFNPRSSAELEGAAQGHAPLEEWAGGKALAERLMGHFGLEPAEALVRYRQDAEVRAEIDSLLCEIAFHLAMLAVALDPDRIVLGAGMMRSQGIVLPIIRARISQFTPFPPEVVPARFLTDAALHGALALAAEPMLSI